MSANTDRTQIQCQEGEEKVGREGEQVVMLSQVDELIYIELGMIANVCILINTYQKRKENLSQDIKMTLKSKGINIIFILEDNYN